MRADPLFVGIDVGTSGARAVVIDETGAARSDGRASMAEFGSDPRDPLTWLAAVESALGPSSALRGAASPRSRSTERPALWSQSTSKARGSYKIP